MGRKLEVDCIECGRALSSGELGAEMVVCRRCIKLHLEIEQEEDDNFPEEYFESD